MRLRRIVLENVCQFAHLDHTFHPGLTGIIGPNGSGKSNLLKAIYFALTGVFRNAGVKADNVAQNPSGKRSAVTLWLEHHGVELEVVRALAGARTALRVPGEDEAILGDNAVTARVVEVLGVDAKTLGDYVFILQAHMADFVEAAPGDRARVFQRLFGAEEFEAVHEFATKTLDRELRPAEVVELPQVRLRVAESTARMEFLLDELERLDVQVVDAETREAASRRLIGDHEEMLRCRDHVGAACRLLDSLRHDLAIKAEKHRRDEAALAAHLEALDVAGRDAEAARVALATWRTHEDRRRRAEQLRKRREQLDADSQVRPEPPAPRPPSKATMVKLHELRARRAQLEALDQLAAQGQHACPTCLRPLDVEDAGRAEKLTLLRNSVADLEQVEEHYRRAVEGAEKWREWKAQHDRDRAQLDDDMVLLGGEIIINPNLDPVQMRQIVAVEDELKREVAVGRKACAASAAELGRLHGRIDQLIAQVEELDVKMQDLAVPPEALDGARADVARLESLRTARARAEGEADGLAAALAADEALLTRLEASEARNAVVAMLRAGLGEVAAVTHRNAAPRRLSEAHLDRLIDDVGETLDMFGSDFRVRLGPSLSFFADFTDGRAQAGGRLSEGQKGVLALAFWVAVNSLFARQIGFLSLDEPTAALDQHNLGAIEVALDRLRGLSEALGLQCLLVTHESSLAGLFDSILQL